jgi:hypothetical protein
MKRAVVEPGRPRGYFLGCQSEPPPPGTFIKDWCETNFPHVIHLPTSEVEVLEPLEFKFCGGDYKHYGFLGCTILPCISESSTFLGNIPPTSLGSKSKTSNTPTESMRLTFLPLRLKRFVPPTLYGITP